MPWILRTHFWSWYFTWLYLILIPKLRAIFKGRPLSRAGLFQGFTVLTFTTVINSRFWNRSFQLFLKNSSYFNEIFQNLVNMRFWIRDVPPEKMPWNEKMCQHLNFRAIFENYIFWIGVNLEHCQVLVQLQSFRIFWSA